MANVRILGMLFAIISAVIIAYLLRTGKFSRKIGYAFIIAAVLLGFIVFAPMFPDNLQRMVLGNAVAGATVQMLLIGIVGSLLLALLLGRIFCGYLCPIGAVQELAYSVPGKKYLSGGKKATMTVRFVFTAAFLIAGMLFSVALLDFLGYGSLFTLAYLTYPFWVFLAIIVISVFVYRPFCRLACPYGLLLSLVSAKSVLKLRRNERCIDCGKCERACPTGEAGRGDMKMECYMCNRCVEACPVNAIEYAGARKLKDETRK